MTRSPKMKPAEQGFTLIEMAVVMSIIMIFVGIAFYSYIPMIGRLRLNSDVRKVDQALMQAKMRAVATGVPTGVIFYRRDGAATANTPDEMYIFTDSTVNNRLSDDDTPCKGCLMNKIYNCALDPLCNPGAPTTTDPASKEFLPIHCNPGDTAPSDTDCKVGSAYMNTHDIIVDGPLPLESGDYFTRILDCKIPSCSTFSTGPGSPYGSEFILFDQFGKVVFPESTTAVTVDSRRIYLQDHPGLGGSGMSDRAGVELTSWASGVTRVVRLGPAEQDEWTTKP